MTIGFTRVAFMAMALCAAGARADGPEAPTFSFSGFGTLGIVHSSEDRADFTSTTFKPHGAGYSHAWSAEVDSLIAAQVTVNPDPRLSAVLQVVSEQNYDSTYTPHVEWANLKYRFTPDLSVRLGRTVLPVFLVSDSRKVAYANPWVRPPLEVYSLVPVTTSDGVDASYRMPVGVATNTIQVTAGRSDSKVPARGGFDVSTVKAREVVNIVNTYEHGFATARLNYARMRLTISQLDSLFDAFRKFGPEGIAIAERYEVDSSPAAFGGVAAAYDPGDWFAMGEWSRLDTQTFIGRRTAWYVSGGYRFGNFTPYATIARARADNLSDPGLTISALPPALRVPASGLNAALNSILRTKIVEDTVSVGGRWDLMKNVSLKVQYDHIRIGAGSTGAMRNVQPDFQPGGNVNVFSATVDFVF